MGAKQFPLLNKILNEPKPLSDSQQKAVLSNKRYIRVIAGAGAGKTETLTRKIVSLLLVEKVLPSSIVAFTFTEKAAQTLLRKLFQFESADLDFRIYRIMNRIFTDLDPENVGRPLLVILLGDQGYYYLKSPAFDGDYESLIMSLNFVIDDLKECSPSQDIP
jgi:hypothetical protein